MDLFIPYLITSRNQQPTITIFSMQFGQRQNVGYWPWPKPWGRPWGRPWPILWPTRGQFRKQFTLESLNILIIKHKCEGIAPITAKTQIMYILALKHKSEPCI